MSASKPYFKNVVNVGDLFFEYSFMYMDEPIVFTCVDKQRNLYLCVCRDAYEQVEWLVSKIDVYTLRKLVGNQISINEALLSNKKEIIQVIWDPKTKAEHSKPFLADNLPDDLLPEEDVFWTTMGSLMNTLGELLNAVNHLVGAYLSSKQTKFKSKYKKFMFSH